MCRSTPNKGVMHAWYLLMQMRCFCIDLLFVHAGRDNLPYSMIGCDHTEGLTFKIPINAFQMSLQVAISMDGSLPEVHHHDPVGGVC